MNTARSPPADDVSGYVPAKIGALLANYELPSGCYVYGEKDRTDVEITLTSDQAAEPTWRLLCSVSATHADRIGSHLNSWRSIGAVKRSIGVIGAQWVAGPPRSAPFGSKTSAAVGATQRKPGLAVVVSSRNRRGGRCCSPVSPVGSAGRRQRLGRCGTW